jgi:hypothetical protein
MRQALDREPQAQPGCPVRAAEPQGGALERAGEGQPERQAAEGDTEHARCLPRTVSTSCRFACSVPPTHT